MGDESYIGFVDAHAERDGRHDDDAFLADEALLMPATIGIGKACVIGERRPAALAQPIGGFIHAAPGQAVDDAGVAAMFAFEKGEQLLAWVVLGFDLVTDIGAIESTDENPRVFQGQARADLAACGCVGGGGQRDARHMGKTRGQLGKPQVLGAKIVAPLGYAVGFVNGKQRYPGFGQKLQGAWLEQTFGCQVQQVEGVAADRVFHPPGLARGKGGVQRGGAYTALQQRIDLILHERDQR